MQIQSYIPAFGNSNDSQLTFENNSLSKLGFKLVGIPHIGLRLRARKIMKNIPPQLNKMLDAGFGTGVYSFTLANRVKTINAIDVDAKKIDYVNENNPFKNINFQRMDLTNLTFQDSTFDLIICSEVLEYIEKYEAAFSELARVLKPEGVLLMTTPHDLGEKIVTYKDYGHVRPGYTKKEVQHLCMKNGLTILKIENYSYYLAEKIAAVNYHIANKKLLLGIFFYPLYVITLLSELLPLGSTPRGIFFKIMRR